jgi:hypothetical protein
VLLARRPVVKVLDPGLAKMGAAGEDASSLTEPGVVVGTLSCMADAERAEALMPNPPHDVLRFDLAPPSDLLHRVLRSYEPHLRTHS